MISPSVRVRTEPSSVYATEPTSYEKSTKVFQNSLEDFKVKNQKKFLIFSYDYWNKKKEKRILAESNKL